MLKLRVQNVKQRKTSRLKRLTNSDRQTDRPTAMGMMSNHVGAPKLSGALCTVERSYWSVAKNITK